MVSLSEIQEILNEYKQSHLLKYWDDLNEEEQRDFLYHLKSIDFKEVYKIYEKTQTDMVKDMKLIDTNMKAIIPDSEKTEDKTIVDEYRQIGLEAISNNEVAVIVLAGGQGTRLGLPFPKGMCPTGLPSAKTLFQLQAERINRLTQIAHESTGRKGQIMWYVMTSEATHKITGKFFKENKYFGLNSDRVRLFKQGSLPCFDLDGKILLEERDGVALAPDGNGGIYKALLTSGILKEMSEEFGIKYIHVHSVDNILVKPADPVFLGKCIKSSADCGVKVVRKTDPSEPLGVICQIDDKYQVLEYSEIAKDKSEMRDDNGDLVYNTGNICNHFFTVDFITKVANEYDEELKLHTAKKVVTHINADGDKARPFEANGVKIEKFIFDVLCYSQNFVAWEVERSEEFSPVKNTDVVGKDCFPTACKDLLSLHKKYVQYAGGEVRCEGIEVSPRLSYAGENLTEHVKDKVFETVTEIASEEELNENKIELDMDRFVFKTEKEKNETKENKDKEAKSEEKKEEKSESKKDGDCEEKK